MELKVSSPKSFLTIVFCIAESSEIEDVVSNDRGRLFAALHSHLGSVLVDIVGGPRTFLGTIDILERYVLSLNAFPLILKKESQGYVLNAMLGSVLTTSMLLCQSGNATVVEIDRAWMKIGRASCRERV